MSLPFSIGVAIPTIDRPAMVREAIRSVLAQRRRVDEIFVSDNHSTQPDDQLAAEFSGHPIRYHWHERRLSIEEHWAWCLGQSRTDFVSLLGDDDLYLPDHFARFEAAVQQFPSAVFFGSLAYCFEDLECWLDRPIFAPVWRGNLLTRKPRAVPRDLALASFLFGTPVCASAVMIKRTAFLESPLKPSQCSMHLDRWLWAQMVARGDPVLVPEVTTLYRMHAGSLSKTATRRTWRSESGKVSRMVLDLMTSLDIDVGSAVHQLNTELSSTGRDIHAHSLIRTRDRKLIPKLLPLVCEKSSLTACIPDVARILWNRQLPRLLRIKG